MKKAIFCATALMFGAFGFAQTMPTVNTSGVTQTGYLNDAQITQSGQNTSAVDQEFRENSAIVDQIGVNWSDIDQSGDVGNMKKSGLANSATVLQDGGNNAFQISDIDQQGDGNEAIVDQYGEDNNSKIQQGNNGNAEDNYAKVYQTGGTMSGDGNDADVLQRYDNNYADVYQNGNSNSVVLEQVSGPNQSEGNYAEHSQTGNRNSIVSLQETTQNAPSLQIGGYTNGEWVTQTGDDNGSNLHQQGEGNISIVNQLDGGLSSASGFHGPSGVSNYADVTQTDQRNYSRIDQGKSFSTSDNTVTVMQSGNGWNISDVTQMGGNSASVTQTNP